MKRHYSSTRAYGIALYAIAGAAIFGWFIQHEAGVIAARIMGVMKP